MVYEEKSIYKVWFLFGKIHLQMDDETGAGPKS